MMNVTNREMYHFNNPNSFKEVWTVGNEFVVDDNFSSGIKETTYRNTSFIKCGERYVTLAKLLERAAKDDYEKFNLKDIKNILDDTKRIIYGYNMAIRELALEEYRRDHYPELPSRLSSIWVCNKAGIKFWGETFSKDKTERDLLKLSLTGNLFKTSDEFLPEDGESFMYIYNNADKYWNPNFKNKYDRSRVEYLFKGKVRVLERIK